MHICSRSGAIGAMLTVCLAATGMQLSSVAHADASISSQYFARMNQERAQHGRAALTWRSDLADITQGWAQHMASSQELAHNPNLTTEVHNWKVVGENVGEGPTIDDLDQAFMNSQEHRDNILDPEYTDVGVGSVRDSNGIIWIAIDFRDPYTHEAAPAPVHTTAPVDHWVRVAPAAPAVSAVHRRPVPARPTWFDLLRFQADLPFAPGCMLRIFWF